MNFYQCTLEFDDLTKSYFNIEVGKIIAQKYSLLFGATCPQIKHYNQKKNFKNNIFIIY